jgi:hypothetical protein
LYLTVVEQKPSGNINIINNNIIINTNGKDKEVLTNLLNLLPHSKTTINNSQSTIVQPSNTQQQSVSQPDVQNVQQQNNTQNLQHNDQDNDDEELQLAIALSLSLG